MIRFLTNIIRRRLEKNSQKEQEEYSALVRAKAFCLALANTTEGGWLKR